MRYATPDQADQSPTLSGDGLFIGVDERHDPAAVAPGYVCSATNLRFRNGKAEPRGASVLVNCGPTDGVTAFTTPREALVYKDPNGVQWFLIVANAKLYATRPNQPAIEIALNGNDVSTVVGFTQAFDKVLLWRGDGPDAPAPLIFENFSTGVRDIANQIPGTGIPGELPVPNSNTGTFFQNRVLVPFKPAGGKKDRVAVGDIGNYTRYTYPVNSFRLNEGESDEIVEIVAHGHQSCVVFKESSILYVDGLVPDANGQYSGAFLNELTSRYGLGARRGWTKVGRDIYFLTSDGTFTSLGLTEEGKLSALGVEPLSAMLPKTFARINPTYMDQAQAATWNDYIYLALPLDDAELLGENLVSGLTYGVSVSTYNTDTAAPALLGNVTLNGLTAGRKYKYTQNGRSENYEVVNGSEELHGDAIFEAAGTSVTLWGANGQDATCTIQEVLAEGVCNAVAVYDTVNRAWASVDEAAGIIAVKRWMKLDWEGRERLFYLTPDGRVRLFEEPGAEDEQWTTITPYVDVVVLKCPANSATIQVNSGDTITAADVITANTAASWACQAPLPATASDFHAIRNLWNDTSTTYGFDPSLSNTWSAPNTTATQIKNGVRFTATNGTLPTVATTGLGTLELHVDEHDVDQIRSVAIATSLTTRGYSFNLIADKRTMDGLLRLSWWAPNWTWSIVRPGVSDETALVSSRTYTTGRSFTDGVADTEADNSDGLLHRANQQDYSIQPSSTAGLVLGDGLQLFKHQYRRYGMHLEGREAPWFQFKIANTTGRLVVHATGITAREGSHNPAHN